MKRHLSHALTTAFAILGGLAPLAAHADWGNLNMPVGVTELSKEIHSLHIPFSGGAWQSACSCSAG